MQELKPAITHRLNDRHMKRVRYLEESSQKGSQGPDEDPIQSKHKKNLTQ